MLLGTRRAPGVAPCPDAGPDVACSSSRDGAAGSRQRAAPRLPALRDPRRRRRRADATIPLEHWSAMAEAQVEASAGTTGEYKGKTAVVVGAGPSGACAASYLARRGFRVKVFERRGDPEVVPITSHRSIIITLRQETIAAMEALGVEFPPEEDEAGFSGLTRFRGVAWCGEGGIKKDAPLQGRRSILAERFAIARAVLRAVRQEHPMAVQCFFDHQCQDIDFDNRVAEFKQLDGSIRKEKFDLLVGADGAQSATRQALARYDSNFKFNIVDVTRAYLSIRGLPPPENEEVSEIVEPGKMAFMNLKKQRRNGKKTPPRITVYGAEDGTVNGIMTYYVGDLVSIRGREEEWLEEVASKYFPKSWIKPIAEQLKTAPESIAGPVTRCTAFVGPAMVLLGDAAHSVTPAMGIGCNMAVEDAVLLDKALGTAAGDVGAAVRGFNAMRYQPVQDAQDLQETIPGAGIQKPGVAVPLVRAAAGLHLLSYMAGSKVLPKIIPTPVYMRYVGGRITASQALDRIRKESAVLAALAAAAIFFIARLFLRRMLAA
eukprot:evm.model.scf_1282.1 EVM.evm.TU.scf_1282.1   scf_1282:2036-13121(+)